MSEKLTLNGALILLEALKLGKMAMDQLWMSNLDDLPESTRQDLYKRRDEVNDDWGKLAPKTEEGG